MLTSCNLKNKEIDKLDSKRDLNNFVYYSCYAIHDKTTNEYKSVSDCGLSEGMSIAVLTTSHIISGENDLEDIEGIFTLIDFRDVPYGTQEEEFDKYIVSYELVRDNDWYVWYYHTEDFNKSGLASYDYTFGLEVNDYECFIVCIDNIEYLFPVDNYLI